MAGRFGRYGDFKRNQLIRKNRLTPDPLRKFQKSESVKKPVRVRGRVAAGEVLKDLERQS
jgi:hypothetical protein